MIPAVPFRWRSLDGTVWTIDTIKSDHALNVMKMLWNECADVVGLKEVARTPDGLRSALSMPRKVRVLLTLFHELETNRGGEESVSEHMRPVYRELKEEIFRAAGKHKWLEGNKWLEGGVNDAT
jgi:hypothetical protein